MKKTNGVTAIELLITLTIVAILASVALLLYMDQARKGRRGDGMDSLTAMSLAEEQYRSNNTTYGTLAQVWGGVSTSTGGYYTLSISNVSATTYTLTAAGQGAQANDTEGGTSCASLVLTMSSGTITRSPSTCWPQ